MQNSPSGQHRDSDIELAVEQTQVPFKRVQASLCKVFTVKVVEQV